jgi:hypothetical protein
MVGTIIRATKKEGQRKAKRCTTHKNQKERRKLVPLVVRSYLNAIFIFIAEAKAR